MAQFPGQATAYTTTNILEGQHPVLLVTHQLDGDWCFLEGGIFNEAEGVAVHLAHIIERQAELRALADLPRGWAAERESVEHEWERYAMSG